MTIENLSIESEKYPIIFFDGICNLCNRFVNRVIRYDTHAKIKFCALQDPGGRLIRTHLGLNDSLNTAVGMYKGKIYTHSDVLKMVAKELGGSWRLILPLYLLPKQFRDFVYNWIARNRYEWFGKSDQCMIPNSSFLSRFL